MFNYSLSVFTHPFIFQIRTIPGSKTTKMKAKELSEGQKVQMKKQHRKRRRRDKDSCRSKDRRREEGERWCVGDCNEALRAK